MDFNVTIGYRIKELRKKRNMTRAQLADGICSVSYISRIENGTRCPNSLIIRQFSKKLGISGDYLLRTIESQTSLDIYELFNQVFIYLECNRFDELKSLLEDIDVEDIDSLQDKQIIMAFSYLAENPMMNEPFHSLKLIDELLDMTYIKGTSPTNLEFGLLLEKAFNYIRLSEFDAAKEILDFLKIKISKIVFYLSLLPLINFYIAQSILAYHYKSYEDAEKYLTLAILEAKTNCYHGILIECYYLRSRIFEAEGKHEKAKHWHDHSQLLIELLLNQSNTSYYLKFDKYIDLDIKKSDSK